ncbi:MAG: hypothetical protein R2873_22050 [Caldilineaceae bacterium]
MFDGGFARRADPRRSVLRSRCGISKGKALGVPVYELMGGKFRDKIRVYADCQVSPGMTFDEIKQVVDGVVREGFTALKIDLDLKRMGQFSDRVPVKDRFATLPASTNF